MVQATHWALTSDLHQRIDSISQRTEYAATAELAADLQAIRQIAVENGMTPAISILQALESTIARGQRGPMMTDGLALLRDAITCGRNDHHSAATYAAALASRLAY